MINENYSADNSITQLRIVRAPIKFSLAYAREHGVTDAILLYWLQVSTCTTNATREANGKTWVYSYSLSSFLLDLPCFTNRQTVYDGLQRLGERDDIDTDYSGKLFGLPMGGYCEGMGRPPQWNKATDGVGWYCVNDFSRLPTDLITVDADDIKEHGQLRACLLSKLPTGNGWFKLSATELAKELPFKRVAIQRDISEMLESGLLERNADKPKLYRVRKAKREVVKQVQNVYKAYSLI